ncbi:MAG: hypothetical protein NVSMB9_14410 [Isosphaeraceae bacterium]
MAEGDRETNLIPVGRIGLTDHGRIGFQVENALCATAAGWALGLSFSLICEALVSFGGDSRTNPGRFNVLHHGGATVIVDYGHNSSSLLALGEALPFFPHERRIIAFSAAGDRRDVDLIRQGEIIGKLFDSVILFEDACNRGRPDGEIVSLLRKGVSHGPRVAEVFETRGEFNAIDEALTRLKPGDLLVVQADQIEQTLNLIQNFFDNRPVWTELAPATDRIDALSVAFSD